MKVAFFEDARTLTEADLVDAFSQVVPTSEILKEQIVMMREVVSQGKMRRANSQKLEGDALGAKDGGQILWV